MTPCCVVMCCGKIPTIGRTMLPPSASSITLKMEATLSSETLVS